MMIAHYHDMSTT